KFVRKGERMDKRIVRKDLLNELRAMDCTTYEHLSLCISRNLQQTPEWREAKTIGITVSIFPEVDTWQLIRKGWEEGKCIAVPKCYHDQRTMNFHQIHQFNELEKSKLGLFEPIAKNTKH